MRYYRLYALATIVSLTGISSQTANPLNLAIVAAKAAAAVKVIPGSEAEVTRFSSSS